MPEETNIAYVTVVLVTLLTFKFKQIVRSWYSVQVTFVCTALWKIHLRCNLPNLFKIRRDLRKLWRNTFWCVFYAPQCSNFRVMSCTHSKKTYQLYEITVDFRCLSIVRFKNIIERTYTIIRIVLVLVLVTYRLADDGVNKNKLKLLMTYFGLDSISTLMRRTCCRLKRLLNV